MALTEGKIKYKLEQSFKNWLLETDWTVLSDVNLTDDSKAEWIAWRAIVRNQLLNYNENVTVPPQPVSKWNNT